MKPSTPVKLDMVMVILLLGSVVSGVLVLTVCLQVLAEPFDAEPRAWGSAHFSTMARSYAEQSVMALKGQLIANISKVTCLSRHTLMLDNRAENARHEQLSVKLDINSTVPELIIMGMGTSKNINGLIRCYHPAVLAKGN